MIIYGMRPVEEALAYAPERVQSAVAQSWSGRKLTGIMMELDARGIPRREVSRREMDELCGQGNHQGVALELTPFQYADLDALAREAPARAVLLVLDQVQDAGNLGAILRSAAALGVSGVILPERRSATVSGAVVRASAGQALKLPVARVTNLRRALDTLRDAGWWTVGAGTGSPNERQAPAAIDWDMRAVIVMGSEHSGVRRLVAEACDLHAAIPMTREVESLNVATAAALLCYEATRGQIAL